MNNTEAYDRVRPYHVIVSQFWFRQKRAFLLLLSEYEKLLKDRRYIELKLNAGNMIYQMMKQLKPDEWAKQNALIYAYRNLVYKLSYVTVTWYRQDMNYLHLTGRKADVMWALAFLTQVYPLHSLACRTIPEHKNMIALTFHLQNGQYVGENVSQSILQNDVMPDIWSAQEAERQTVYQSMSTDCMYQVGEPRDGQMFALPDGRIAKYVPSNQRFFYADKYGVQIDAQLRHDISASLMKDFEDLVRLQTTLPFDTYQRRYQAFMSRAQILEAQVKGLDVSIYDHLPIAERGLPQAQIDTIRRTDAMDKDSLKYIGDKVKRNIGRLSVKEQKDTARQAATSVVSRIRGYNVEYYMYTSAGSSPDVCKQMHSDRCVDLYNDFARLDSYGELVFPVKMYKVLCNEPEHGIGNITDVERMIRSEFGHGYLDFLRYQLSHREASHGWVKIYQKAMAKLEKHMK